MDMEIYIRKNIFFFGKKIEWYWDKIWYFICILNFMYNNIFGLLYIFVYKGD